MTTDVARRDKPDPVLHLEHLSKSFAGTKALDDVSLEIRPNEVHALVGTNGSGKSTLIKILAGYHRADRGAVATLNGEPLHLDAPHGRPHRMRFVHQNLGLINQLDVMDNLALSGEYPLARSGRIDWRTQRQTAQRLLARFGLTFDVETPLGAVTPVERVIVAIAAALAGWEDGPCLLVLDEPTAVLPPRDVRRLFDSIAEVRARGASVLYVSHRLDEIFRIADRVTVLRGGRLITTTDVRGLDQSALAGSMVGQEVEANFRADVDLDHGDEVVLEGRGLHGKGLRGVDIRLRRGEILGVAGLPGSGRDELPYLLAGAVDDPVSGDLRMPARAGGEWIGAGDARSLGIPLVPADRAAEAVFAEMSVVENLTIQVLDRLGRASLDHAADRKEADVWMRRFAVKAPAPDAPITVLSGGNQQKVVVSRCLAIGADVVILCEPTAGVDIGARIAIYELVAEEARRGLGVIVCSSDVGDLMAMCTRVVALHDGHVVATLQAEELTEVALLAAMESSAA